MTLIVAICAHTAEEEKEAGQGIIIASDSQASIGPVTYRVHKIVPIEAEWPLALAAGAGDLALIKKAVDISGEILLRNSIKEWNNRTPSSDQFRTAISEIECSLIEKVSFYETRQIKIDFDFILGSVDTEGSASLYVFDSRGIAQPVHDDPGFACIGSGFYLGGNLLLQQFYSPNLDWMKASLLSSYVINEISRVDPGVGPFEGDSFYFRSISRKPTLGELTDVGFNEEKSEYEWRRRLLKRVWEKADESGAKEIYRKLEKRIRRKSVKKSQKTKN